jgi:hypothetical protein
LQTRLDVVRQQLTLELLASARYVVLRPPQRSCD